MVMTDFKSTMMDLVKSRIDTVENGFIVSDIIL